MLVAPLTPLLPVGAEVPTVDLVVPTVETVPVHTSGDAADDPAIWVHPSDPTQSLVIVNNKRGALETYDLGPVASPSTR